MKITVKRVHAPRGREPFAEAEPGEQETAEPGPIELPEQATVIQLFDRVGISPSDVSFVLVNGLQRDLETRLHDGDAMAIVGRVTEM